MKSLEISKVEALDQSELAAKEKEYAKLEKSLVDKELKLATLRGELGAFETEYLRIVGARLADIDDLAADIAQILSKLNPDDDAARKAADSARKTADNSANDLGMDEEPPKPFTPSRELKKIYRTVAKLIHPDLAADDAEKELRQRLMSMANEAYAANDIEKLVEIMREWNESPESIQADDVTGKLKRIIRKITMAKKRIKQINAELREMRKQPLFKIKAMAEEAQVDERDLLAEMAAQVDEKRERMSKRLRQILVETQFEV